LKYQGVIELADPLGKLLAQTYQRHHLQADIVLPVPLHPERQRQRGFNQATLLARACARQLGIPWDERLLIRRRATSSQVGLTASERRANVAAAFSLPSSTRRIRERTILLIDDVSTTGATLEACARPLLDAGAQAVWGLVLAKRNFAHERSRNASRSLSFR
jgi:ComF family protein